MNLFKINGRLITTDILPFTHHSVHCMIVYTVHALFFNLPFSLEMCIFFRRKGYLSGNSISSIVSGSGTPLVSGNIRTKPPATNASTPVLRHNTQITTSVFDMET